MAGKKQGMSEPEEPKQDPMRWLLTYSDMITLLMLFFIILYSLSSPNAAQFQVVADNIQSAFEGGNLTIFVDNSKAMGGVGLLDGTRSGVQAARGKGGKSIGSGGKSFLMTQAGTTLQSLVKLGKLKVITTERGVVVSLFSDVLFQPGSAVLAQDDMTVLQQVAGLLTDLPNPVVVEGYTDSLPVTGSRWSSNWQLSADRAVSVLETLEALGVPSNRLSAAGYGGTQPRVSEDTPEGRAYNRRVDILIVEP